MGDAATPVLPDFTAQTAAAYKTNIDAGFAVADRISWAFAPHEQDVGSPQPDMTVRLEAGAIFDGATLTEVAAQSTGTITAPTTDPRIDRVVIDDATGAVSVITGTEAPSPSPPAITTGKIPICQVALVVSQTTILNADITDERPIARNSGGGGFDSGTLMLFQQTAAPTGWTKQTTHNDKALRIVSGTAGSAGATAFTTVFGASKTAGNHTLTESEMPSHTHTPRRNSTVQTSEVNILTSTHSTTIGNINLSTTATGGSGSHNHTLSLDLQYVDVIIASKD